MNQTKAVDPGAPGPEATPVKAYPLRYSEQLIRRAFWSFWRRTFDWKMLLAGAVVLAGVISLLVTGDRSWRLGLLASILGMAVLAGVLVYCVHFRGSLAKLRRMKSPEAVFEAGENTFRFVSDVGASELSWKVITAVWRFPDYWLLFFAPSQFSTLPLADIDREGQDFILDRVKSRGAKIS